MGVFSEFSLRSLWIFQKTDNQALIALLEKVREEGWKSKKKTNLS